jgi:hypothetical protein
MSEERVENVCGEESSAWEPSECRACGAELVPMMGQAQGGLCESCEYVEGIIERGMRAGRIQWLVAR